MDFYHHCLKLLLLLPPICFFRSKSAQVGSSIMKSRYTRAVSNQPDCRMQPPLFSLALHLMSTGKLDKGDGRVDN